MTKADKGTCSVVNCTLPVHSRGWCRTHYLRAWRNGGDPSARPRPRFRTDLTGQRFGTLVAAEFLPGRARWLCRCDCGQSTSVMTHALTSGNTTTCGDYVAHHRSAEPVGYNAMHDRLRRDRGPAADHDCADCGAPAVHWSYDHDDAAELVDHLGFPYSLDADHYVPRCLSCHRRVDDAAARTRSA